MIFEKLRGYASYIKDLSCVRRNEWQVAIRKKGDRTLFQGNIDGFRVVKNSIRYWYADPFLFSYQGKDYLFVEMFDRWKEKGVLGVCRIKNGKCGRFHICLEVPGHLSYPCVYEDEAGIHMVPECYQSGEVWVYRCVKFPYHWEKETLLMQGYAVDTTPCDTEQGRVWMTTRFASPDKRINNNLWQLSSEELICISEDYYLVRGAGHFIHCQNRLLRPSQNCVNGYGVGLVFNEGRFVNGIYREKAVLQIAPPVGGEQDAVRIHIDNACRSYNGIHTYNSNERYEVIDLRYSNGKSNVTLAKNLLRRIRQIKKRRTA